LACKEAPPVALGRPATCGAGQPWFLRLGRQEAGVEVPDRLIRDGAAAHNMTVAHLAHESAPRVAPHAGHMPAESSSKGSTVSPASPVNPLNHSACRQPLSVHDHNIPGLPWEALCRDR
jgi:hypothetical protein